MFNQLLAIFKKAQGSAIQLITWIFFLSFVQLSIPCVSQNVNQHDLLEVENILTNKSFDEEFKLNHLEGLLIPFNNCQEFESHLIKVDYKATPSFLLKAKMVFSARKDSFPNLLNYGESILGNQNCSWQDSLFTYYTLASYFQKAGYNKYALSNYKKLFEAYQEHPSFDRRARLIHQIGLVHLGEKKYASAVVWLKKAIHEYDSGRDFLFPYQVMNNLGITYKKMGLLDSALVYFKNVETFISEELADSLKGDREIFFEGLVKGNQGSIYLLKGEKEKAISLLEEDLKTSESTNHRVSECNARISLAKVYLADKNYPKAFTYLKRAAEISKELNLAQQLNNCYRLFAEYFKAVNYFEKSSYYYEQHLRLNDSLNQAYIEQQNQDFALEMALITQENEITTLKLETKQKSLALNAQRLQLYFAIGISILLIIMLFILLVNGRIKSKLNDSLVQKNQEILKRGLQLENAVLEKDLMLKEMHHRIKNNLQMVQSLLRLQAAEIDDPLVNRSYEESINRLSSMSLIHQNLYTQEKYKSIAFKPYLESLLNYLDNAHSSNNKNIKIIAEIEEVDISIDHAIPTGVIITELISNAFRHAFINQDEGIIKISLFKIENFISLKVSDNGKGLEENFSLDTKGFGTTIIQMLINQINAKLEFKNLNGANFSFSFEDIIH